MKKCSIALLALAWSLTMPVFADAYNLLFSFSSTGPDVYADGTPVLDGEWYALVWTANVGGFGGITVEGLPAVDGDEITLMAPLAVNQHCPLTFFQVDSKQAHSDGAYSVCLLDTRNAAKTAVARKTAEGRPAVLNAVCETREYRVSGSSADSQGTPVADADWGESSVQTDCPAYIASIAPLGARVELVVKDMFPGVKYNIKMGSEVDAVDDYALQVPQTRDNPTFIINSADAHFFKVVREPLIREVAE